MTDKIIMLGLLDIKGDEQIRRGYRPDGCAPTLNTMQGGNREPKIVEPRIVVMRGRKNGQQIEPNDTGCTNTITTVQKDNLVLIKENNARGYDVCSVPGVFDTLYPSSKTRRGRVQDGGKTCPTITAETSGASLIDTNYRIRKLTPRECWRLMGFYDDDFDAAQKVNSNSQLYKQAGNSIVVNCLEEIFKNLIN